MNTPDIDIERLREDIELLDSVYRIQSPYGDAVPPLDRTIDLIRGLLLSLADQDGELWMEKRCKHGELEWHKTFGKTWENGVCPGGSRVRVWPKVLTEGKDR